MPLRAVRKDPGTRFPDALVSHTSKMSGRRMRAAVRAKSYAHRSARHRALCARKTPVGSNMRAAARDKFSRAPRRAFYTLTIWRCARPAEGAHPTRTPPECQGAV